MQASVVTFAQLPDDEPAFLTYLAKTGDIWARAELNALDCEPAPVGEFVSVHAPRQTRNGIWSVYLGFRADVLSPALRQDGRVDPFSAPLVHYRRGDFFPAGELAQSNLAFYRGSFAGDEFLAKPAAFLKWADNVLAWARRHSQEQVPVYRCNYSTRATARVAAAVAGGLRVWY